MRIPSKQYPILKQSNKSSILGTIIDSFNLDLTSDFGKIKVTKSMLSKKATGYAVTDFGSTQSLGVGGFSTLGNSIYMISGQRIWVGGNSPIDSITLDVQSNTPTVTLQTGDIKNFNNKIYVTNGNDMFSSSGSGWTDIYTYSNASSSLLEVHKNYLYFTFDGYKIGRMSTADSPTVSGAGSLDLALPGFTISFMRSDGDYLWIGLVNNNGGYDEKTYVYKWDGSNTDSNNKYLIESRGVMAGCLVNGIPYIVDSSGRLMYFNGGFFKEKDKLPLKSHEYIFSIGTTHERGIHPNGMMYDSINEEILINISNVKSFSANVPTFYDFKGGVWSYKEETGLVHKYSPSLQPITDSGVTGLTDYGQYNILFPGAITSIGLRPTEKGRILFGSVIYNRTTGDYTTTSIVVLCSDDTLNTSQKYGYFSTSEVRTDNITETWKTISALYDKLLTSTDKIILKYKTRNDIPTRADITWSDINILTTTTDVSAYVAGDEIQCIQGIGSGKSFHIQSISENAGTYTIILDDSMASGVIGLTGIAIFSKWKKLGEVTYTDEQQYKTFTPMSQNISPKIQIKVAMQFTGDNNMDSLLIDSSKNI